MWGTAVSDIAWGAVGDMGIAGAALGWAQGGVLPAPLPAVGNILGGRVVAGQPVMAFQDGAGNWHGLAQPIPSAGLTFLLTEDMAASQSANASVTDFWGDIAPGVSVRGIMTSAIAATISRCAGLK